MYKDKDKQKEANRAANKRYRESKGITPKVSRERGITLPDGGCPDAPVIPGIVLPDTPIEPAAGTSNNLVEHCVKRAKQGEPIRDGDPAWPYTRHLTPPEFIAWCKLHRPLWLTSIKPGDAGYLKGTCKVCCQDTGSETITKCLACCSKVA